MWICGKRKPSGSSVVMLLEPEWAGCRTRDCKVRIYEEPLYRFSVSERAIRRFRDLLEFINIMTSLDLKLSICIGTFNRAAFIGSTLKSILSQATHECEIVICDNASTDNTGEVVAELASRFDRLRYVRHETNLGLDGNYDFAVEFARGEYCWLFTDDDLMKPGAVSAVLRALRQDLSLIIVNIEARDFGMTRVLQRSWLDFESDRLYGPSDMEPLFVEAASVLKYIGCIVIKRAIWLARERKSYYGSGFIYLGVIFQAHFPGKTLVIAEPFISYRMGNAHAYSPQHAEIWFVGLPSVIESMKTLSEFSRHKFWNPQATFRELLWSRALGLYSMREYKRWVRPRLASIRSMLTSALAALMPGALINVCFVLYYTVTRRSQGKWQPEMLLGCLGESQFHFRHWRVFKRES